MPATPSSAPAPRSSYSTPPWWRASTCAAAGRARARPLCSIRRRRWKASTPSCCRAARPSGSTPPPACRPGCASRAAASRSATRVVPIVPAAILFDLLNGGDKNWGRYPPYRELGYEAAKDRGRRIRARQRRRRPGRHHRHSQGRHRLGLGADARRHHRRRAGGGQCRRQRRRSATDRISGRRRSSRTRNSAGAAGRRRLHRPTLAFRAKGGPGENTTLAVVATDATLSKAQCNRLAVMAQDGLRARDLSGAHPARRRRGVRRRDRRQAARRSDLWRWPNSAWWPPM